MFKTGQELLTGVAGVLALTMLSSPVPAVEAERFAAQSTGDLIHLCSASEDQLYYNEALQFCYGFFAGVIQFHHNLTSGETIEPITCPDETNTRKDAVDSFLAWAERNPTMMATPAIEGVIRSAEEAFPCP